MRLARAAGGKDDSAVAGATQLFRSWDLPVIDHEAGDTTELRRVMSYQGAVICQCDCGDQHVVAPDQQAPRGEVGKDPTVMFGGGIIKRQRSELLP